MRSEPGHRVPVPNRRASWPSSLNGSLDGYESVLPHSTVRPRRSCVLWTDERTHTREGGSLVDQSLGSYLEMDGDCSRQETTRCLDAHQ